VPFSPDDIHITSNNSDWSGSLNHIKNVFCFKPHFGWVGAIEKSAANRPVPELAAQ